MHTLLIILTGFATLGAFLLVTRCAGGTSASYARAAAIFTAVWFIAAAINMWFGVAKAGYSVSEELPMFGIVFGVPALAAVVIWWKCRAK
jgi:hypothetical protein